MTAHFDLTDYVTAVNDTLAAATSGAVTDIAQLPEPFNPYVVWVDGAPAEVCAYAALEANDWAPVSPVQPSPWAPTR